MEGDKDTWNALNFIAIFDKRTSNENGGGEEEGMSRFTNTC